LAAVASLNSQVLLELFQAGQSDAAAAIFDRYVVRLIALARARIGAKLQRRVDAEDVVQSAFRSFFVHAKADGYQLSLSGDLWRLLASITLHKLYGQIEKHSAARRTVRREAPANLSAANAVTPEPSPAEVVAALEQLHLAIRGLTPHEQAVLSRRLQGQSLSEVAAAIGKSQRTVRRLVAEAKRKIELRLLSQEKAAAPTAAPPEPTAPLQFSNYVLEKLLGAGGMGKVFRARDKSTGRKVAVKALHKSRQTDRRAVARLVQEVQILSRLSHPNIVAVHGLGRFPSGGYFAVMDLVDGVDLERRLRQGPLPFAEAKQIIIQVASATHYAHEQGVVHCDLKPANVLLDKHGQACVTDFGFAFLYAGASPAAERSIGGTAGFVAPEILSQESEPTPSADVYALGRLLETLLARASPTHPSQRPEDGLLAKAHVISRRCLAEVPNQRFHTVNELVRELQALS
jgi:RNA polymerase sigma factor (sigma-70 family)